MSFKLSKITDDLIKNELKCETDFKKLTEVISCHLTTIYQIQQNL